MTDATREMRQPGHDKAAEDAQEQADIERYIRGWQENPMTEEELGWSDTATREHFAELP